MQTLVAAGAEPACDIAIALVAGEEHFWGRHRSSDARTDGATLGYRTNGDDPALLIAYGAAVGTPGRKLLEGGD
ncbi:hypothetical protein Atai01_81460 [Amycolatopsis taiwanensis]|uniref:Uncharacterized protein n=1 Tax=Amycolatopsis taiwanensis TaxID=342230 RepID=A0A9W6VLJ5_9PSEU|nr:hypothetical protein Atai01_81460 [Amycolatopsis taiwanensis]